MTRVYGYSDDNVCWEDKNGGDEIGCFDDDVIIVFADCSIIRVGYSKQNLAIWWIEVEHVGTAKHNLTICTDEDAEVYSDIFEIEADVVYACTTQQKYKYGKP